MTAVWLFLKGIPAWIWLLILIVCLGLAYGQHRHGSGLAEGRAELAAHLESDKVATAKFNAETAKKDAAQAEKLAQVGFQYERDKAHALDQKDAVIADLRSGAIVLRKQWRCPKAPMSDAPSGSGVADDAADVQFTSAGDLVRITDTCQAQVIGLQAILTKERQ